MGSLAKLNPCLSQPFTTPLTPKNKISSLYSPQDIGGLGRVFKPLDLPQPELKTGENLLKVPRLDAS